MIIGEWVILDSNDRTIIGSFNWHGMTSVSTQSDKQTDELKSDEIGQKEIELTVRLIRSLSADQLAFEFFFFLELPFD